MSSLRKGVTKDYTKAHKYFTKAAAQGNSDAQLNLGHMYNAGIDITKDRKKN